MISIRLARAGAKKRITYRVVAIDHEKARDGRFLEILGHYNPRRNPPELVLNRDRIDHWIKVGARPSETVRSFLKRKPEAKA